MSALTKDYLFPLFCLGCGEEGVWICERCRRETDTEPVFACPGCHAIQLDGVCCRDCRRQSHLLSHMALTNYRTTSVIGRMIHALKYEYAEELRSIFPSIIERQLLAYQQWFSLIDIIVPVPLHPRRLAQRGFNQAEMLATMIGRILDRPVMALLRRGRYTKTQTTLARHERATNVAGAFHVVDPHGLANQRVLLVDDVYTTGSTMQECARTLREAGARDVQGWSVARG